MRRTSAIVLALGAVWVMALGAHFALFRAPLSTEDMRYLDRSLESLEVVSPALNSWLQRVFYVMGGYMFATGLAMFYIAVTGFRTRARGAALTVAVAGAASIGGMAVIGLLTAKWHVLLIALVWLLALALYQIEGLGGAPARAPGVAAPAAR